MKWLTGILVFISLSLQAQKEPVPVPSSNLFMQAKYMAYMRKLDSAFHFFQLAGMDYKSNEQWDSLAIVHLSMSRMKTLLADLDEAESQMDSAENVLAKLQDTSSWIKCYYPFTKTGIALAYFNIPLADSLGRVTLSLMNQLLPKNHLLKVNMLNDHGIVQYYQNNFLIADSLVNAGLDITHALYEELDMRNVPSLNLSATIKDAIGYSRMASKQFKQLIRILEYHHRDSSYDYALVLNNLAGAVYNEEGPLASIKLYEQSLQLTSQFKDRTNNLASIYYNMANMLNSIGYRNKALNYINACLNIFVEDSITKAPFLHYIYILKANILTLLEEDQGIDECFDLAEQFIKENHVNDKTTLVEFLRRKAASFIQQERFDEALLLLDSSLTMFADPSVDIYANDRPEIYFLAGEAALMSQKYNKSLFYYSKSIDDFIKGTERQHIQSSYSYAKMTNIHLALKNSIQAKNSITKGLKILLKDSSNFEFTDVYNIDDYYILQHFNYVIAAKIQVLLKLFEESGNVEYLESALAESYTLEEILKDQDSEYLEDSDAIERTNEYYEFYEIILNVRILSSQHFDRNDLMELSLLTSESTKDLMIKNTLGASNHGKYQVPDSLLSKEQELILLLKDQEKELNEALLENKDVASIQKKVDHYSLKLDRIKNVFKNQYSEYYQSKYGNRSIHIEQLQNILGQSDATIINYFLGNKVAYAFVLTENSIHTIELSHPDTISYWVKKSIENLRSLGSLQGLEKSYHILIQPLREFVTTENITIIPDGLLNFLPFEALIYDEKYLVSDWNINYSNSFYSWAHTQGEIDKIDLFCMAPGFDAKMKEQLVKDYPDSDFFNLIRQPNALQLATTTNERFGGFSLSGNDAQESQFKNYKGNSNVLILATHAEVADAYPLYSKIALLPDSINDGYLHAYEILNMKLPYDLAILTACQTGLGKLDRGQGAASLSQAFRYAGCDNVMMSLWSIDEQQSTQLVNEFLDKIDHGQDLTSSLTEVKRDYINSASRELSHPFYWSGLVLVGGPHGSNHPANNPFNYFILIGALLLLGIFFYWSRSKNN